VTNDHSSIRHSVHGSAYLPGALEMIRQYSYRMLIRMLTDKRVFVMRQGERYFFAQIVE
jgi:hypothetical protein